MTNEDIDFIERELELELPGAYRTALVPFAIPALYGSTEHQLWDDAEGLVRINREMRAGARFRPAWPHHMYAVGYPHGDEWIAMDTRDAEGPVWWLDHGIVDHPASYRSHARFADWVEEFYRDVPHDLVADGHDPDRPPTWTAHHRREE